MMRYQQRVLTPDSHQLTNGKKSSLKLSSPPRTPPRYNSDISAVTNSIEGGGGISNNKSRFRSSSNSPPQSYNNESSSTRHESPNNHVGDVLFQWGQKKRARVSRSLADESSSSSSAHKMRQQQFINKVQKRTPSSSPGAVKLSTATVMPPPPPSSGRSSNLRNCSLNKEISGFNHIRNIEERSGSGNGSPSRNSIAANRAISRSTAGKRSPTPEKVDIKKLPTKDEKVNGSLADNGSGQSEKEAEGGQKGNSEVIEWPRIYVNLSRKEKEEDFMAMRGTKLPHRPKKRAKTIDRALQYCFPGMWLSDLTKSRYEVREKKCVKKQKRRGGLKGMESMETDSE